MRRKSDRRARAAFPLRAAYTWQGEDPVPKLPRPNSRCSALEGPKRQEDVDARQRNRRLKTRFLSTAPLWSPIEKPLLPDSHFPPEPLACYSCTNTATVTLTLERGLRRTLLEPTITRFFCSPNRLILKPHHSPHTAHIPSQISNSNISHGNNYEGSSYPRRL